ncbi:acyltransferase family protein [Candidatus Pantoea multigeneris]|uniref:Acyltransferase n=1 Tax=Candidatus Pantoea multigeneris TaxID=2608357 RepID=A0ABX0RH09_9GAMM|nr:acyltransferase [Pantoea multigeneris]NIF24615.1 acyltransferase [Pantoea multigeneris]
MNKISYLEGLRGLSCFIVIIDHCINSFKPDLRYTSLSDTGGIIRRLFAWTPLNIIYSGIAPVCIFFILSGFVLSMRFNNSKSNDAIYQGVIKRYPRLIVPILIATMFMYVAFSLLQTMTNFKSDLEFSKVIAEAIYFAPFEHIQLSNYALWTISFEIYGSLIVFSLLAIFGRSCYRIHFYSLIFLFLYLQSSYYSLFIFGMILNDLYVRNSINIPSLFRLFIFFIGLLLVTSPYPREGVDLYSGVYSYMKIFNSNNYNQLYHQLMLTGSSLIFISVLGSQLSERTLNQNIFLFLGKISFPLYILHVTIISMVAYYLHDYYEEITILMFIVATVLTIMICFALSVLFEKYIDVPAINLSNVIARKLS